MSDYIKRDEYNKDMSALHQVAEDVSYIKGKLDAKNDSWTVVGVIGAIILGIGSWFK